MSTNVSEFLSALSGGKDNFEVLVFDDKKAANDTSKIFEMQREKNVNGLLDFWKEKAKNKFFELSHPETSVKTRAVYSVQHGMANFVFMLDETGGSLWVLAQCELLVNLAITDDVIYKNSYGNNNPIYSHISKLSSIDSEILVSKEVPFGYLLSQKRPYHHFYDQLKFLLCIGGDKEIAGGSTFFIPKFRRFASLESRVFLFPNAVGNNYVNQNSSLFVREANQNMEALVYKNSLACSSDDYEKRGAKKKLSLWFGITGQKRSWLEQVEGCINVVRALLPHFEGVVLYIDGMTAMQGKRLTNEEDDAVYREIEEGLTAVDGLDLHSLVGLDYREKIICCDSVDLFIANAGTGCMVPLRFVKKPGVLHSNTKLFTFRDEYPNCIKKAHGSYVQDVANGETASAMHVSYHIPWQHIYNLAVEVLNETKGTEIAKIEVPPVEDVKVAYDEKAQEKNEIDDQFFTLSDKIKSDSKSPDILREVAFVFERTGDLYTAMKVMEKAHLLRPNGPVIKRKLAEYRKALES